MDDFEGDAGNGDGDASDPIDSDSGEPLPAPGFDDDGDCTSGSSEDFNDGDDSRHDGDDGDDAPAPRAFFGREAALHVVHYGTGKISLLKDGTLCAHCKADGHGQSCVIKRRFRYKNKNRMKGKCLAFLAAWLEMGKLVHCKEDHTDAGSPSWPQRHDRQLIREDLRRIRDAGDATMGVLLRMEPRDELASSDVEPDLDF